MGSPHLLNEHWRVGLNAFFLFHFSPAVEVNLKAPLITADFNSVLGIQLPSSNTLIKGNPFTFIYYC